MKFRKTPIASAVALALMSAVIPVQAQQAAAQTPVPSSQQAGEVSPTSPPTEVAQATPPATTPPPVVPGMSVTVTGIRCSLEKSLETKRNSDSVIEVITSDDIGKLPDKNIADAVQRVPGVTISSAVGRRRRLRRKRSRQHARHQPQPDADADQRTLDRLGRLVRARPGADRRTQRQLLAAAVRAGQPGDRPQERDRRPGRRRRRRRGRHHHAQAAGLRASSSRSKRSVRRRLRRPAEEDRPADQRALQLEERRRHGGRHGPGVLREASPAPRRPGDPRLRARSRREARWPRRTRISPTSHIRR